MRRLGKRRTLTTIGVAVLALFLAQLPNTSAPAVTYCIGPAAYPPDLPDCLDPVVEAKKEADRIAAEQKAAADAAAEKARKDKRNKMQLLHLLLLQSPRRNLRQLPQLPKKLQRQLNKRALTQLRRLEKQKRPKIPRKSKFV